MNNLRLNLICLISFLTIFGIGSYLAYISADTRNTENEFFMQELTSAQASAIERRLERSLSATYILAQEIRQNNGSIRQFEEFAQEILHYHGGISNLQLAPNGVVEKIHPLKGNEKAIGHNILRDDARRKEALLALREKGLTLAGPFELIQGGMAIIGRNPVFLVDDNNTEYFWGFTSALLYLEDLLNVTELSSLEKKGYRYLLQRIHPDSGHLETFAGSSQSPSGHIISTPINVPNSQWFLKMSSPGEVSYYWYETLGYSISALIGVLLTLLLRRILLYPEHLRQVVKEQTRELHHLAHNDHLTKLPNRLFFQQQLERIASEYDRYDSHAAIFFVDLDDFKRINDLYGHSIGDQLLIEVSGRFKQSIRTSDILARLGGDEFAIILQRIKGTDEAGKIALNLIRELSAPMTINHKTFSVSASIGISILPQDAEDPETAMQHADIAMYEAKKTGKNNFYFFDEKLQAEALHRMKVESQLFQAVEQQEFVLHFQPIVDTSSGNPVGYEALIRWQHPEDGLLYPDKFIQIAEHSDVILKIGYWVIDQACKTLHEARQDFWISVNVSARQFGDPELLDKIKASVNQYQIGADRLIIEVTESSLMEDTDTAIAHMNELKKLGVKIALDDFGTGYSSLALLKQLPIDFLKIDRSFVQGMDNDSKGYRVIGGIVSIAQDLGLETVAEGVETQKQLTMLWGLKTDYCQGYFFSKPVPLDQLSAETCLPL